MAVDTVGAVCVVFPAFIFIWFAVLLYINYSNQENSSLRLNILSMRCALCLPLYSIIIYASLLYPPIFAGLQILITFVEGASLYTFFSLLVVNLNGPCEAVSLLIYKNEEFCCNRYFPCLGYCLCTRDFAKFYKTTTWWIWHAWWTRLILVTIASIGFYVKTKGGTVVYLLFSVFSAVILITAVIRMINFYENVFEECKNINGVMKILLVKASVGQLVLLSIAQGFLATLGGGYCLPNDADTGYGCTDIVYATQRSFCVLMLLIFTAMALIFFHPFAAKMGPPKGSYNNHSTFSNFCSYFCTIWNCFDTWGIITYTDSNVDFDKPNSSF